MWRSVLRPSLIGGVLASFILASPAAAGEWDERWPETVPRFRWWEYFGTASLLATGLALRFTVDTSGEPNWRGGILFDDAVYEATLVDEADTASHWRIAGDVGFYSSFVWSTIDPVTVGMARDWETAGQMFWMNLEGWAVFSATLSVAQIAVRRERPATHLCDDDPARAEALKVSCDRSSSNPNKGFIAGHTGSAATAATLTCIHHAELGPYGHPAADAAPCATMWALTATTAASRIAVGKHYLTDTILGIGIGIGSGLVPYALHYAQEEPSEKWAGSDPPLVAPTGVAVSPHAHGVELVVQGVLF